MLEELPTRSYLQYYVNIHNIIEEPVHLYDIWMIKKHLYLQLSNKLLSDFLFFE